VGGEWRADWSVVYLILGFRLTRATGLLFSFARQLALCCSYAEKFAKLGFENVTESNVVTAASAAAQHCKSHDFQHVFAIGEPGMMEELTSAGIQVTSDSSQDFLSDEEFAKIELDPKIKAVVVGWDRTFNYRKLAIASLYLQAGCTLVATNPDPSDIVGGRFMPGNGCSVAAIRYSIGDSFPDKDFVIAGKPNGELIKEILTLRGFSAENTLFFGDRLDTDIKFAINGGIDSVLVLSGCTTETQLAGSSIKPTYVSASLGVAIDADSFLLLQKS